MVEVPLTRLDPDIPAPRYARPGDAGADLVARHDAVLAPGGGRALIATGVVVAIPPGYAGFVQPRSGLALRHAITLPNAPATIDPGYRGEIRVILLNLGTQPYQVRKGDRIAQMVIARYEAIEWDESELGDSRRGEGGFGSSGR